MGAGAFQLLRTHPQNRTKLVPEELGDAGELRGQEPGEGLHTVQGEKTIAGTKGDMRH